MNPKTNFTDYQFLPEGGRSIFCYYHYLIMYGGYAKEMTEWPLAHGGLGVHRNHVAQWYLMTAPGQNLQFYLDKALDGSFALEKIEAHIAKHQEAFLGNLPADLHSLSNDDLIAIVEHFNECFYQHVRTASIMRGLDRAIQAHLKQLFAKEANPDLLIQQVAISQRHSVATEEELAILKAIIAGEDRAAAAHRIHQQFTWITCGYYQETPKPLAHYEQQLSQISLDEATARQQAIETRHEQALQARHEIVKQLTAEDQHVCHLAGESTYAKDYYKFSINQITYRMESVFTEMSHRFNRPADWLKDLHPNELISLLQGETIDEAAIEQRIVHNVVFGEPGNFGFLTGEAAEQFERDYLAPTSEKKTEFRGRIACLGKATGKARIILGPQDFDKLESGDILVVLNTSPDFVPILHRAAAIVAEEGGLTAHASVVSREMGIPCIVGVHGATKQLTDGQAIIVDATTGTIKVSN